MNRDTAILQMMLTEGVGARTLSRLLQRLSAEQQPVEEFVLAPPDRIATAYGLRPAVASAIRTNLARAEALRDELESHRIKLLARTDSDYPSSLLAKLEQLAPPVLFVRGDHKLLGGPSAAVAGARHGSEQGLRIAYDCGSLLGSDRINVVSGYAPGTDTAAHLGALAAGGSTTLVLASGILAFQLRSVLAQAWDDSRIVIVSEFSPGAPWRAHNAMQRNRTICALSGAVILVEAGLAGGTYAAGKAAQKLNVPLYVVDYPDPPASAEGNRYFLRHGAHPLTISDNGTVSLDAMQLDDSTPAPAGRQGHLSF